MLDPDRRVVEDRERVDDRSTRVPMPPTRLFREPEEYSYLERSQRDEPGDTVLTVLHC
jgi:hypothetical protein